MTNEMLDIINAKEQHIAIQAYSGTGKTTTMLEYVKAHPNERILFLVYNKAMANDFTERLKGINCCCEIKTIHALAYRWFMRNYLSKQLGNITVLDIKNYINNNRLSYEDYSKIKFYFDMFLSSSLDNPLKLKPLEDWDKKLLVYVNKLWDYYSKDSFVISHNIYLKLFQLNKIKLDYDTIILDECNDINECMLNIVVNNLDKKVIVVGDSYQMINAFNFNTNGLQILKENYGFKEYKLTDSFRIGEDIAKVSSKYLSNMYNENIDFNGLGKTKITDIELRDGMPNNPIYILCRTRLGGLKFIYSYIKRFRSRKVYYVGGLNSFKINDIEKMIKSNGNIFLNGKKYNVKELKRMINEGLRDIEIIRTVQMYDFCCQDSKVLERLRQSETTDKSEANVILLTAHQSKGLTLNNVIIADDFKDSIDLKIENDLEYEHNYLERMANAEVNLLYVALTRATNKLDLNSIRKEDSNYFESNFLGGL